MIRKLCRRLRSLAFPAALRFLSRRARARLILRSFIEKSHSVSHSKAENSDSMFFAYGCCPEGSPAMLNLDEYYRIFDPDGRCRTETCAVAAEIPPLPRRIPAGRLQRAHIRFLEIIFGREGRFLSTRHWTCDLIWKFDPAMAYPGRGISIIDFSWRCERIAFAQDFKRSFRDAQQD